VLIDDVLGRTHLFLPVLFQTPSPDADIRESDNPLTVLRLHRNQLTFSTEPRIANRWSVRTEAFCGPVLTQIYALQEFVQKER